MDTETMDKLFLELSQFTRAATEDELILKRALRSVVEIRDAYFQQGELEDRALSCVYDMYDAAKNALEAIDD